MSSRDLLHFALCGDPGPWDQYNPYKVTSSEDIQKLLTDINRYPSSPHDMSERIGLTLDDTKTHVQALLKAGLAEEEKGVVRPTFAIFRNDDIERLLEWAGEVSQELVAQVHSSVPEVKDFIRSIGMGHYAEMEYVAIVAFGLDFGGLDVLEERGLVTTSRAMPGDRSYIFSGVEQGLYDPRKAWMWGHTDTISGVFYCTHGMIPRKGGRKALPDILWTVNESKKGDWHRISSQISEIFKDIARTRDGYEKPTPKEIAFKDALTFLDSIGYVSVEQEKMTCDVPVFENGREIETLGKKLMRGILTKAVEPHYKLLGDIYATTAPAQHGIDIREGFNFVYHLLFEKSVDLMLKERVIEPPPKRADGAVYACCVIPGYDR